jgi:hypothetical protein
MRMKKTTPRKRSSSERININRIWNEMEEFRDKLDNEKTGREAVNTTPDCDREVESVFSFTYSTKDMTEEDDEDDDLSCYCSGSSCFSSRSVSVSSNYSTQVNISQDSQDFNIPFHHPFSILPLTTGSDHKLPPSPGSNILPLPPSIQSTKAMLDLMARLKISKLNTLV